MKKNILFIFTLCSFAFLNAQNKYSLQYTTLSGVYWHTNLKGLDNQLSESSLPTFTGNQTINSLTTHSNIVFGINKWNVIAGISSYSIKTEANENGHYYSGRTTEIGFGVGYDVIKKEIFSLSPYLLLGTKKTSIYLDYELKEGVIPTNLHLQGSENTAVIGLRSYVRLKQWREAKWELFFNADVNYNHSISYKWRINNVLFASSDFSTSSFSVLLGLSIRYNF